MNNLLEIINWLQFRWNSRAGGFLSVIVVIVLMFPILSIEIGCDVDASIWIIATCGIMIFLCWMVSTLRAFQQTGYAVLLWCSLIIGVGACFYYIVYPYMISGSSWNLVAFRYWGTGVILLLLLLLYYFVDFKCYNHSGKLQIIFLVDNSTGADKQVEDSLKEACNRIEDSCDSIEIKVAPFGIVNGKRKAERYVKSFLCQADAVIYSRVMDGNEDGCEGYVFTEFCSFANSRILSCGENRIGDVDSILARETQYAQWNIRNHHNSEVTSKIKVAKSIEELIRLYSACIYVLKHRLSTAIEIAHSLYNTGEHENDRLRGLSHDLLEFVYLEAEYVEELEHKDYEYALGLLKDLSSTVPFITRTLSYELAMARVLFHLGKIKESKKYTKLVKKKDPWGYAVNTAFYAMYEGHTREFVSCYKKLPKLPAPTEENVKFVIKFLEDRVALTNDRIYQAVLLSAVAYQMQYLDLKKAKLKANLVLNYYDGVIHPDLKKLLESILSNTSAFCVKN